MSKQETAPKHTPGPWYILEVNGGHRFVAAKPTEDHPYFRRTKHMDVCGDEDYPRKDADLVMFAAAPQLLEALKAQQHLEWHFASCAICGEFRENNPSLCDIGNGLRETAKTLRVAAIMPRQACHSGRLCRLENPSCR